LFLPAVAAYIDNDSISFLDKELFTDITSGDAHEADIVVRCKFADTDRFFLIHVESESKSTPKHRFPRRMFNYYSRLLEKHDIDVYPIVLFTFDNPRRKEPDSLTSAFPDLEVLNFRYRTIQLNTLNWRDYIRNENPVAAALMTKMSVAQRDRPYVKLECLRLLASLRLNPAKSQLISGFVHTYLKLTGEENAVFEREVAALEIEERQPVIQITNEWIERGREEGAISEARGLLNRIGQKRLGAPSPEVIARIAAITDTTVLGTLCERVLDVESWLELFETGNLQ